MYLSTAEHKSSTVSADRSQTRQGEPLNSIPRSSGRDGDLIAANMLNGPAPTWFQLSARPAAHNHSTRLSRLIQSAAVQPKLSVAKPEDKYEQEADQVADKVMTSLTSSQPFGGLRVNRQAQEKQEPVRTLSLLQPQPEEEEEEAQAKSLIQLQAEEEEEEIQAKHQTSQLQRQSAEEEEEEESVQPKPAILRKETAGIKYIVNRNEPKQEAREEVQTKPETPGVSESTTSNFDSSIASTQGSGFPLADGTRAIMESQIGADFSNVRLHTDSRAVQMSGQINAQAFTHGNNIYFNAEKYTPNNSEGQHLLAHELSHTVQQGASVQKKSRTKPSRMGSHVAIQRSWLGDAWDSVSGAVSGAVDFVADSLSAGLDWIKDQFKDFVQQIPGYRLLAVVLGQDPISGTPVARNGRNFIEAGLDIIPFGNLFKRKLEQTGALEEAATWLDNQMAGLDIGLSTILSDLSAFWSRLSLTDIGNPSGVLSRAADIIRRPIGRIVTFAGNVATEFLRIVKNYVVTELATFVRDNTRGYPLLTVLLSQDPITEEPVERSGMNLIRGFMLLSAEGEEQLRQMEETGSLQRAADWIDGAVARLDLSWETIRNIFTQAWNLISIENLMNPLDTFRQLVALFAGPVGRIINFIIEVGIKILEFIKNALLSRLANYARGTRGYPLITVILGQDPFTAEPVERSPENIIHGFMSLMDGGEEQFQQMKESGAIQRTTAWIEGAVARLGFTWDYITGLFIRAWNSFSLQDLISPFEAFARIVGLFVEPIRRLFAFIWEVLKKVIEILLIMMRFPIGLVNNIITKAMQAIEDIKRDPVGFLKNLLRAIKQGFSQFFDSILTHLLNGLTGWLFGELEEAGITPPRDLSLGSIFGFVLDVLGITMERIWQKLGDRIGHDRVARIRGMIDRLTGIWTFVKDVMTRGPIAIWEYIVEKISNLWDMVLEHIKNWVMTRIVERVVTRLLSMLDPTGIMAVVNSVIALYSAIESFIRYIREMLEIVNSFVEGVAEIARGDVTRAAEFLENSLARAMPIAIGFLANQVGLSGLGRRIGEMIGAVREKVDEGLDWLIDRAVSAGTAFLDMARSGVAAVRTGIANLRDWWTSSERITTRDGQEHEITFSGSGASADLVVRTSPQSYITYLNDLKATHNLTDDQISPAINKAREIETEKQRTVPDDQKEEQGRTIHDLVSQLANITMALPLSSTTSSSTPPVYGPLNNGFGSSVSINRLTSEHEAGRRPTITSSRWQTLVRRKEGGSSLFVRGHLLNDNLGGPGNTWNNLTPLTQNANNRGSASHLHGFETQVKDAVNTQNKQVNFLVSAGYGRTFNSSLYQYFVDQGTPDDNLRSQIVEAEQFVPSFLECQSYEVDAEGHNQNLVKSHWIDNAFTQEPDEYALSPTPKTTVYLSDMSEAALQGLSGVNETLAKSISDNKPYRTKRQVKTKNRLTESQWTQIQSTPGKRVRIYRR